MCPGGSVNSPLMVRPRAHGQEDWLLEETQSTIKPLPPQGFPHFHLLKNAESRSSHLHIGHPDAGPRWRPSHLNEIVSTAE